MPVKKFVNIEGGRAYVAGIHQHFQDQPDSSLEEVRICLFLGPLLDLVAREMAG